MSNLENENLLDPVYMENNNNNFDNEMNQNLSMEDYESNEGRFTTSTVFACIAAISSLIVMSLLWIIYAREHTTLILWTSIFVTLGVFASLLMVASSSVNRKKSIMNSKEDGNMVSIVILFGLFFAGFFLISGTYLYLHRPFHYNNLINKSSNETDFKTKYGEKNLDQVWGRGRRIHWFISFFSIIAFIGFLGSALASWIKSDNENKMVRLILGFFACIGLVTGFLALFKYYYEIKYFMKSMILRDQIDLFLPSTIKLLLIFGMILLFLSLLIVIMRSKNLNFLIGSIFVILLLISFCFVGLLLRQMQKSQFGNMKKNCFEAMKSVHKDSIKNICEKYLPSGTCVKESITTIWEDNLNSSVPVFLNGACCGAIGDFYLRPIYLFAIWSLFSLFCMIIVCGCLFFLSDFKFLSYNDQKTGIIEFAFLGLGLLILVGFVLFYIFYSPKMIIQENPKIAAFDNSNNNIFSSKNNTSLIDNDFKPVDTNKLNKFIDNSIKNNFYKTKDGVIARLEFDTCTDIDNCIFRVAVLSMNAKITNKPTPGNLLGDINSKQLFFSGDDNINNEFLLLKGKPDEINEYFSNLHFEPINDNQGDFNVLFKSEEINKNELNAQGLKSNETYDKLTNKKNGNNYDYKANNYDLKRFVELDCSIDNSCLIGNICKGKCSTGLEFLTRDKEIIAKLNILSEKADGTYSNFNSNSISGELFLNDLKIKDIPNDQLTNFKLARPIKNKLNYILKINDEQGHYLPQSLNIPVEVGATETIVDEIKLLTKDGKGCEGDANEATCWANKKLTYGDVEILVKDENLKPILNTHVNLYYGSNNNNQKFNDGKTDLNGLIKFENVPYDQYLVTIMDGNLSKELFLQDSESGKIEFIKYSNDNMMMVIEENIENTNEDIDLVLGIENKEGKSCKVTPINKYCAYAMHYMDVKEKSSGVEIIKLEKMTNSYYHSYLKPSPSYSKTCSVKMASDVPYYNNIKIENQSLLGDFNFVNNHLKVTKLYKSIGCFTGFGQVSYKSTSYQSETEPLISDCKKLFPKEEKYSMENLSNLLENNN